VKLIAVAFIFWGIYPAAVLNAGDKPLADVSRSTAADAEWTALKSTPAVSALNSGYKDMVQIPAGEFMMGSRDKEGSADEHPRHKVSLDAYFIDKYKVTAAQYRVFADATGRKMHKQPFPDKDNCAAVYINWHDAEAYCEYYGKRLPAEAEWENAARAGSDGKYCFGDDEGRLVEYAWYWGNSGRRIHPVGRKKPNRYGIYDMHGNTLEWVYDWYDGGYYAQSPAKNPKGPAEGGEKAVRGGSSFVSAGLCRSAKRMRSSPDIGYSGRGFRCAASVNMTRQPGD